MKSKTVVVLIGSLLVFALACTAGGITGPSQPDTRNVNIEIANQSPYEICYVLISGSDEESWGDDWLGDEETLAAGSSKTFSVGAGAYDVKVVTCNETTLATFWDIDRNTTVTVGGRNLVAIGLVNESDTEICFVYISDSTGNDWGDDWLGQEESILEGGGKRAFFVRPGTYDLLAQDCDGNDLETQNQVAISQEFIWRVY
jgi:hypothetical protein